MESDKPQDLPEPDGPPLDEATEDALIDLITRHFDGALSEAEFAQLETYLGSNDQACALYNDLAFQSMSVAEIEPEAEANQGDANPTLSFEGRGAGDEGITRRTIIALGVALTAAAVLTISLFMVNDAPPYRKPKEPTTVRLENVQGDVMVKNPSNDADGNNLRAGDRIEISSLHDSASVVYPDGTRLLLAGETTLVFYGMKQKRLELLKGQLTADVAPQPPGKPMIVRTPEAELTVVGTAFSLSALSKETELGVSEGSVRMSKSSSRETVEVAANQIVKTVDTNGPLTSETLPPIPDTYEEDFEPTIPERWQMGEEVKLASSNGNETTAVLAEKADHENPLDRHHQILSHKDWNRGIVAIHEDSVLRFKYRFEKASRFFHVLLGTRSFSGANQTAAVLEAKNSHWTEQPVGEWHDAEVPLDGLVTLNGAPRPENAGVFFILFDSQIQNAGLTIDDIRVERGL